MTTLAALSTKDALIMGCDSLGSVTMRMVDPFSLFNYFDDKNEYKIRIDETGTPLLKDFHTIYNQAQILPYNHMTHVDKLFSLEPLEMGVMITGISSIGNFTIKNLINQFKSGDPAFSKAKQTNYTVNSVAKRLFKFIDKFYKKEYESLSNKPSLELMIGGYDKKKHIPSILKIHFDQHKIEEPIKDFGIVFGGQMTEIQRIVFGTDTFNRIDLISRNQVLFESYHKKLSELLTSQGINVELPKPTYSDFSLFENWSLNGFDANWGDFSERNAIECVKFFIEIMIKSQQFSNKLPTVGGDVQIALITKTDGFKFIGKNGDL